jgi:hypothetical protein
MLRSLERRLVFLVLVYAVAGVVSQKLVPGVDEIFPFFSWSLFSGVPNRVDDYTILIDEQDGRTLDPPVELLRAPASIAMGNRSIARKVIQNLGSAQESGDTAEAARLARVLESEYLRGRVRYRLVFERYEPLVKWKTGADEERRVVARFDPGDVREDKDLD